MNSTKTAAQYGTYKKPTWAPPSWIFGPVWTVLYILIAVSFGYVGYLFMRGTISLIVVLPFLLNLVFNFSYIFIQFRLRNFILAAVDVVLVLVTTVWLILAIYPIAPWVAYSNTPYLLWVCFASALQLSITAMNPK